jgi:RNA polymerase sigma-70 factor (ECF subfamily)
MSGKTFEAMLARNLRALRRLVEMRLRSADDADDVVQEILLRAFTHKDQLRSEEKFRTWIWSIAVNEIRSFFRRRHTTLGIDDFPNLEARDTAISSLARLEQIEACEWMRACIAKLSEHDQLAIRLVDLEEKSLRAAAAALHSSVGAAKSTHFRARRRLNHIVRASGFRRRLAA